MLERGSLRVFADLGKFLLRRLRPGPRRPWLFMLPGDIGLFLKSARTDVAIARRRQVEGARAAFEAAYRESDDPWASAAQPYRYQRLKYDKLIAFLPRKRVARAGPRMRSRPAVPETGEAG